MIYADCRLCLWISIWSLCQREGSSLSAACSVVSATETHGHESLDGNTTLWPSGVGVLPQPAEGEDGLASVVCLPFNSSDSSSSSSSSSPPFVRVAGRRGRSSSTTADSRCEGNGVDWNLLMLFEASAHVLIVSCVNRVKYGLKENLAQMCLHTKGIFWVRKFLFFNFFFGKRT